MSISVLIITKNEERDLPGCLESVRWSDDIHVFDSFSTDKTTEIAKNFGAKVKQRVFDDYASHRNASLKEIEFAYQWVLILDADERIPCDCANEMQKVVTDAPAGVVAYRLQRRDFLWSTWLKRSQISPFYLRLVRYDKVSYERAVNEVLIPNGTVQDIRFPFDHFPFSKGVAHWISKHNTYSTMEASRWLEEQNGQHEFSWKTAFLSRDFHEKRFHQKGLFYKFPGRPLIKFIYIVIFRRGFMDGSAGFTYAMLQCIYEYFIVLKQKELLAKINQDEKM